MIRVRKGGAVFEIQDFLTKLYVRNGYEIVTEEPKEEPKPKAPAPKKTTRKTTKKPQ